MRPTLLDSTSHPYIFSSSHWTRQAWTRLLALLRYYTQWSLPSANAAGNVFGRVRLSVCLSCSCSNFQRPWPTNFNCGMQVRLQNTQVEFIYPGHQIKVRAKGHTTVNKYTYSLPAIRWWSAFKWKAILSPLLLTYVSILRKTVYLSIPHYKTM